MAAVALATVYLQNRVAGRGNGSGEIPLKGGDVSKGSWVGLLQLDREAPSSVMSDLTGKRTIRLELPRHVMLSNLGASTSHLTASYPGLLG